MGARPPSAAVDFGPIVTFLVKMGGDCFEKPARIIVDPVHQNDRLLGRLPFRAVPGRPQNTPETAAVAQIRAPYCTFHLRPVFPDQKLTEIVHDFRLGFRRQQLATKVEKQETPDLLPGSLIN